MVFGQPNGSAPRQMFDVSDMGLKCATCSAPIKELPFKPARELPVYCRECNRNRKKSFGNRQF